MQYFQFAVLSCLEKNSSNEDCLDERVTIQLPSNIFVNGSAPTRRTQLLHIQKVDHQQQVILIQNATTLSSLARSIQISWLPAKQTHARTNWAKNEYSYSTQVLFKKKSHSRTNNRQWIFGGEYLSTISFPPPTSSGYWYYFAGI